MAATVTRKKRRKTMTVTPGMKTKARMIPMFRQDPVKPFVDRDRRPYLGLPNAVDETEMRSTAAFTECGLMRCEGRGTRQQTYLGANE
mmetsp:Transcript_6887/g.18439  ORF Transcript_6887/g.18439 Transcript_6887/m.18439 type:complete len:88 (+) Transcript_6887:653-916(+)